MDAQRYHELVAELRHLKSSNWRALGVTAAVSAGTALAIWLSISPNRWIWLLGQLLLGGSMIQWFVLLHDCGHRHFFASRWLNVVVGHVAGLFCMLPFFPWQHIHRDHHLWVGWGDLDPTLQATRPQELPAWRRILIDTCWRFWIPIFTLAFGVLNFWNLPRLWRRYPTPSARLQQVVSIAFPIAVYALLAWALGDQFLRVFGLAFLVFLVLSDPLLLSQHSHLEQQDSGGAKVTPVKLWDQDLFSRNIICPPWLSLFLLHFDSHGVHHLVPNMPCYHLGEAHKHLPARNQIGAFEWLLAAKRMPAHRLLFQHRGMTGYKL